ncbi:MAG: hypothetical protein KAU50_04460 [Candidatus Marinimicrobia bacterium]|nr:hypothetical protein [Candidatus Neomarinimicrobiota bacterium]
MKKKKIEDMTQGELKRALEQNRKAYRQNFEKLKLTTPGQPGHDRAIHKRYSGMEHYLDNENRELQKALGVYLSDPCPARVTVSCIDCPGYYTRASETKRTKGKQYVLNYDKKGAKCRLK